jgi:hypothetical protein
VEEFCIGVTFLQISNSGTLLFPGPLRNGQINHLPFEPISKIMLLERERPILLSNVTAPLIHKIEKT